MRRIYVIHENDAWVEPLRAAFEQRSLPFEEWHLDQGALDLTAAPPEGVFYNRMSASSHKRNHRFAPEYTSCVLAWLEWHGRRVINTSRALHLEINKIAQYAALEVQGIRTPRTVAAVGREAILEAVRRFNGRPFMLKPNRGGSGLGVRLFREPDAVVAYLDGPECMPPVDGITMVQDYIEAPEAFVTRVEFVGRRFLYALRVDTSRGYELCPSDICEEDRRSGFREAPSRPMFEIVDGFEHPLVARYQSFLEANGIHIAGIEFIVDRDGVAWTYDVNTNTNYNPEAEARAARSGHDAIAAYLGAELSSVSSL
jgi:hypothetical protein